MSNLPPGLLLVLGAWCAIPLSGRARRCLLLVLPLISLGQLLVCFPVGTTLAWPFLDMSLMPVRVDRLSLVWGCIFHLAAWLGILYLLHDNDWVQPVMSLVYAGAAIGAVFAGDLLTLFVYWELTAVSSAFLVWSGGAPRCAGAGSRYLLVQVAAGVLLLAGAVLMRQSQGTLSFGAAGDVGVYRDQALTLPGALILLAFGIKAAFPLLHSWLPDAYPVASPGGMVFLSGFTTKLAIYALIRGFAGWEPLIVVGSVMAIVPLLFALLEDDIRRSLAYCLINQLGFMVVAAGVGSPLAINGAAGHAVAHILYNGLLLMAVGAVLHATGTARASRLGGLAVRMPWVGGAYLVGAAAISMPLFCGFVTKSLTLTAVAESHHAAAWITLVVASIGVFLVCGLRIPYQVFIAPPTPTAAIRDVGAVPANMLLAMLISALACFAIGIMPGWVYLGLPYQLEYHPYSLSHVVSQLQLLSFSFLAFLGMLRLGWFPFAIRGECADVDWLWRVPLPALCRKVVIVLRHTRSRMSRRIEAWLAAANHRLCDSFAENGQRGVFAATGQMALYAAVMLVIFLLAYFR